MPAPRGRILIIDDELYVRRALSRMLRTRHDVELAPDGPSALQLLASGALFDVILCDVMMPGMSGIVFHEELSKRWPNLADALIFVTGGVFTPEAEMRLQSGPNPVLRKPVEPSDLVDTVDSVLLRRKQPR